MVTRFVSILSIKSVVILAQLLFSVYDAKNAATEEPKLQRWLLNSFLAQFSLARTHFFSIVATDVRREIFQQIVDTKIPIPVSLV